jgi:Ca2+:H+ antiporter
MWLLAALTGKTITGMLSCCCLRAVVAIMLPTLLSSTAESVTDFSAEVALSRFESVLMLLAYGLFLVFQLVTHR